MKRALVTLFYVLSFSLAASAQQAPTDDPVASAPVRLGVFGLDPGISLTNFGVDTNVFNELNNAKRDLTFTLSPRADIWLRTGRGLFSVSGNIDVLYYKRYTTERALNRNVNGQYEFRLTRLRPFVSAGTVDARDRPGYEVDVRARRFENQLTAGAELRVASKSFVQLRARRRQTAFAGDAVFEGQKLDDLLGYTSSGVDLEWRQRLTSLTTWIVRGSAERDRFGDTPSRNSNSTRVVTGVELGRFALIRGTAFVGYRHLEGIENSLLPRYTGVVAAVSVSYTAPSQTRIGVTIDRELQYSYAPEHPYYVDTGWTADITQRLVGRWDAQIAGGRHRLAYRQVAPVVVERGVDPVSILGGGIGYRTANGTRISFDVRSQQRGSVLENRRYKSLRSGLSVTYGF